MKLKDLLEMFVSGDLNSALVWDETPNDVKDMDGNHGKIPIIIPDNLKDKKSKKRKRLRRRNDR